MIFTYVIRNFRLDLYILGGKMGCEHDEKGETNVSSQTKTNQRQ